MKHKLKVTIILLSLFILTQFIGLYVIDVYSTQKIINGEQIQIIPQKQIPYGLGMDESLMEYEMNFLSLFISFIFAILLIFVLTRIKAKKTIKFWFYFVTVLALGITFTAFFPKQNYFQWVGILLAIPIAYFKIYKGEVITHNLSELLIYPGVAAIFVPLLNFTWLMILLIIISIYDMWAVWKSKLMQKMAKFQMDELNIFAGIMIPYVSKAQLKKIKLLKEKIKNKKITKEEANKKGVKVNIAALGGGDIVFTLISAGVMLKTFGVLGAILTIIGATFGLSYLMFFGNKNKMYPAMPFITIGIFLAIGITLFLV